MADDADHIEAARWLRRRGAEERTAADEARHPRVQRVHEREAQELDRELDRTLRRMSPAARREFERERGIEIDRFR